VNRELRGTADRAGLSTQVAPSAASKPKDVIRPPIRSLLHIAGGREIQEHLEKVTDAWKLSLHFKKTDRHSSENGGLHASKD